MSVAITINRSAVSPIWCTIVGITVRDAVRVTRTPISWNGICSMNAARHHPSVVRIARSVLNTSVIWRRTSIIVTLISYRRCPSINVRRYINTEESDSSWFAGPSHKMGDWNRFRLHLQFFCFLSFLVKSIFMPKSGCQSSSHWK